MKTTNPKLRPHTPESPHRPLSAFSIQHSAFSISPAFSLVEVLFAVMILGIGFIMVAAIFPVGIQQGRDAIDDTTGRTIARAAANRAAAGFRSIGDAAQASNDMTHLQTLKTLTTVCYRPIDPTNTTTFTLPTVTITNAPNPSGTIGGGGLNLYQLTASDAKYLGQDQYLSQLFFRTKYDTVTKTGTLNLLALAMRDGRASTDLNTPLGSPYVKICQTLTDGKSNIYSDLYIRSVGMTDADIAAFLGTNGAIVTVGGGIIRMQDSPSIKGSTLPSPTCTKTWADLAVVDAYMFSTDVPVIGSYTLTTSLP